MLNGMWLCNGFLVCQTGQAELQGFKGAQQALSSTLTSPAIIQENTNLGAAVKGVCGYKFPDTDPKLGRLSRCT